MLSYSLQEAIDLLASKQSAAERNLESVIEVGSSLSIIYPFVN